MRLKVLAELNYFIFWLGPIFEDLFIGVLNNVYFASKRKKIRNLLTNEQEIIWNYNGFKKELGNYFLF